MPLASLIPIPGDLLADDLTLNPARFPDPEKIWNTGDHAGKVSADLSLDIKPLCSSGLQSTHINAVKTVAGGAMNLSVMVTLRSCNGSQTLLNYHLAVSSHMNC